MIIDGEVVREELIGYPQDAAIKALLKMKDIYEDVFELKGFLDDGCDDDGDLDIAEILECLQFKMISMISCLKDEKQTNDAKSK